MGFGNGYHARTDRGGKRYDNSQVAHVWNAQRAESGQSNNGNFYFRGRAIWSYGSHFLVGFIMPDGIAFMNRDSYSVSTSGHQSDARHAVSNREVFHVAGLTDLEPLLSYLSREERGNAETRRNWQARGRSIIRDNAEALAVAKRSHAGAGSWWSDGGDSTAESAGAYLARLLKLPAAAWPKLQREAAKAKAEAKAAKEKAARDYAEKRALQLADMSDRYWRNWIADMGTAWNDHNMRETLKELRRARGLMLKATRGKLAAASRLESVRRRIKSLSAAVESFDANKERRERTKSLRHSLAVIRNWRDATPEARMAASWATLRDLDTAAERVTLSGRLERLKASAAELARLAHIGRDLVEAENARQRRLEAERAARAEAERKALWLAGERVGRIRFDSDHGGAALRIVGDVLETSHGAEVPLSHAIKVFRFVKLVRKRGEPWRTNGKTIRVGHFQVDRIDVTGDFTAGCHFITWQEVERVAKIAGVFDCPADDSAVIPSNLAA